MRLVLFAVLLLLPAAAAQAKVERLGPAVSPLYDDGGRTVAWQPDLQSALFLDGRDGTITELVLPDTCSLAGLDRERALLSCNSVPVVMELGDGTMRYPPKIRETMLAQPCEGWTWEGIGAQWIRAQCSGYHWATAFYVNWHTGAKLTGSDDTNVHRQPDLDARRLFVPLCEGAQRPTLPYDMGLGGDRIGFVQQDRGWWLAPGERLVVRRCGSKRRRVLTSCVEGCGGIRLQRGRVTWFSGDRVRVARSASGHGRTVGTGSDLYELKPAGRYLVGMRSGSVRPAVVAWRLPGAPRLP